MSDCQHSGACPARTPVRTALAAAEPPRSAVSRHALPRLGVLLLLALIPFTIAGDYPPPHGVRDWYQIDKQPLAQPSCSGNACTIGMEVLTWHATGQAVDLSNQFSFVTGQQASGLKPSPFGSNQVNGNAKAAATWGVPLEQYMGQHPTWRMQPPQVAWDRAGDFKLLGYRNLYSYQEAADHIANRHTVAMGVRWTSARSIATYNVNAAAQFHSVCAVDFSPRMDADGKPWLLIANPWGFWQEISPAAFEAVVSTQGYNRGNIVISMEGVQVAP